MSDQTKPAEFSNDRTSDFSHIKGWGIARDPQNDPTYPMKKRTDAEIEGYTWKRPSLQPVDIEVLRSVERKNYPAVFGKTLPPRGLSGAIRRAAYRYSESSYGRWMPLVMADRIDMVEGVFEDLSKGTIPNFFKERGWTAEWKYNRKDFVIKSAVAAAITTGLVAALLWRTSKNQHSRRT